MKKAIHILSFFCFVYYSASSQVPLYYQGIDFTLVGDNLKSELASLISTSHHTDFQYTSSSAIDTWDIIKSSDTYLLDSTKVYLVYGYDDFDQAFQNDISRDKSLSCHGSPCDGLWNREHVYPKSLANPSLSTSFPGPGTDVHNLRSCDYVTNTFRGNRKFGPGNGIAGVTNDGYWYPGDEWKGDIARMMMYMYLRYPNQCPATDVGAGISSFSPQGDLPDIFLMWNAEDPVSVFEINRNNIISSYQGNRNPFIDNPFLATAIWSGPVADNPWGPLSMGNEHIKKYKITITREKMLFINSDNKLDLTLYDVNGRIILKTHSNEIFLNAIVTGIYFLKIEDHQIEKLVIF